MKTAIWILTILPFACGQSADRNNLTPVSDFTIPYVLDSLRATNKTYHSDEMQVPVNDILYIGNTADTININKYDRHSYENYLGFQDFGASPIIRSGLKLAISRRQLLTIDLEYFSIPPPPTLMEDKEDFEVDSIETEKSYKNWKERPRDYIQAIPVFIFNATRDTVFLDQQDGRVIMIQEAKDENGEWKPIEFWGYSECGNSYGAQRLLPNDLALVKVYKYNGDFETDIRLKLKNGDKIIYSDSFKGKINKSQFELPPGIRDNYLARKIDDKAYLARIFLNK